VGHGRSQPYEGFHGSIVRPIAAATALLVASQWARADEQQVLESLKFESGTITLGNNLASLALTPDFQYLSPADTKRFLVEVRHNPPQAAEGTLGAIVPAKVDLTTGEGLGDHHHLRRLRPCQRRRRGRHRLRPAAEGHAAGDARQQQGAQEARL
jgi:hypothetical protein